MHPQKLLLSLLLWLPLVIAGIRVLADTDNSTQAPLAGGPPFPPGPFPPTIFLPVPCLDRTPRYATLEELVQCLDDYTIPERALFVWTPSGTKYANAQPRDPGVVGGEEWAWRTAILHLTQGWTCAISIIPAVIQPFYRVDIFPDATGRSFCVLSEKKYESPRHHFRKGWGTMVVPFADAEVSRDIHFSAPHPGVGPASDEGTPRYAAAAFKNTGAKSLLVAGRHRDAYPYNDREHACVEGVEHYSRTDSAHAIDQPFFIAQQEIKSWQDGKGCDITKCAYIQIHRKFSCPDVDAYLSAGLGFTPVSVDWYNDNDSPAKSIRDEMTPLFTPKKIRIPSDVPCAGLTATDNVFGRLLNGRTVAEVCTMHATTDTVTGRFVHIEQTTDMLSASNYVNFAKAVKIAIDTSCRPRKRKDSSTLLCV
ncbi:hypothetical protein M413DRAFT_21945 [Hebeloma cylindrosporum]|uniref:Uncharacterized protein n=1 Tax=Hebeloma cylindrosporum TaxID=76867 RepID=A0A0C2Z9I7_HEBCY|nr:hypothetical protein M413DRAFT_21945 [Hebeloma cylindrosporum h7]